MGPAPGGDVSERQHPVEVVDAGGRGGSPATARAAVAASTAVACVWSLEYQIPIWCSKQIMFGVGGEHGLTEREPP